MEGSIHMRAEVFDENVSPLRSLWHQGLGLCGRRGWPVWFLEHRGQLLVKRRNLSVWSS